MNCLWWFVGWFYGLATFCIFFGKTSLVLFLFLWTRWTLPRFRYDQLMRLGWQGLLPLSLANVAVSAVVLVLLAGPAA